MGIKLPGSAVSTAPKQLREIDLNAKMSKSKKKKLKKRAKRNQVERFFKVKLNLFFLQK